jgi:hypothetical protein
MSIPQTKDPGARIPSAAVIMALAVIRHREAQTPMALALAQFILDAAGTGILP